MDNKMPQYMHFGYSHIVLIHHALNTSKGSSLPVCYHRRRQKKQILSESLSESAEEDTQDVEVEHT